MREIRADKLWIGNARDARSHSTVLTSEIDAVVDLAAEEAPASLPRSIIYLRFPLRDGSSNDLGDLRFSVTCVAELIARQKRTLVCCSVGMSRSPLIAAAALARAEGVSFQDVLKEIQKSVSTDISPALFGDIQSITD